MKRILLLSTIAILALSAGAQQQPSIEFSPVSCFRADENPVLQMKVEGKGQIRAYFRRVDDADWCSVNGDHRGPVSAVTMPAFEDGEDIEYFFVLLDGKRVIARSPKIYRAKTGKRCDAMIARHIVLLATNCGDNGIGSMPAAMGAGFSVQETSTLQPASQESPADQ